MSRPTVTYTTPRTLAHRKRGACVRIGTAGAASSETSRAFWLNVREAEEVLVELEAAVQKARAAAISGLRPPEPPLGNVAALEAA